MSDDELVRQARIMSGMMIMGEPVAFGSDAGLIDALADAIERLTRERDDMVAVCDSYAEENQRLFDRAEAAERKVEMLRAALAFYAQHSAYRTCTVYMSGAREITAIERDCGERARAALAETEEG